MITNKDFNNFLLQAQIENLKKRIEELESGEVYVALITEIGRLRAENDELKLNSLKVETIRRILE